MFSACSVLTRPRKHKSVVCRIAQWLALTMFRYIRWLFGTTLMTVLFIPFGVYHTMTEPYVVGTLWGFMLPIGYVAAASGVAIVLYSRSRLLKKIGFGLPSDNCRCCVADFFVDVP
jgi:hypothetical protein